MRIKYNFILFIILVLCSASCNDFLDELPDNRTELDTEEKITKILVTAYPTTSWNFLAEYYSDNTDDNGNKYSIFDLPVKCTLGKIHTKVETIAPEHFGVTVIQRFPLPMPLLKPLIRWATQGHFPRNEEKL